MGTVVSTSQPPAGTRPRPLARRGALGLCAVALGGCVARMSPVGPAVEAAAMGDAAFTMPDGARLPYRAWLPDRPPGAVVLALHGFNDSRDAWEYPAPVLTAAGIALYAPDQRGFGATEGRGLWPGTEALVDDAAEMARLVRAWHPGVPLVLMGESMGAAVLMVLATGPAAPEGARYVLVAPAVWGRARMSFVYSGLLWLAVNLAPGMTLSRAPVEIVASDNREALIRLSTDPLTIKRTRMDALGGLVDLMDAALAAAPRMRAEALFQYGGRDQLVPREATEFTWRALPAAAARTAYYPQGYHLLLRDLDRARPIGDIVAWVADPGAGLPSGADGAAAWLRGQG